MQNKKRARSLRDQWTDNNGTKCKASADCIDHTFCNIEYEWADESSKLKDRNALLVSTMPNFILPESEDPPNKKVTYSGMTEQNIDDWIAQSMNRSLLSMLNPKKKYSLPPGLQPQLRKRYKGMFKQNFDGTYQQYYFHPEGKLKNENHLLEKSRKKQLNLKELVVPGQRLSPKEDGKGTPIRVRQEKLYVQKPEAKPSVKKIRAKTQILKMQKKMPEDVRETKKPESKIIKKLTEPDLNNSIYSYNIENVFRKSIIEPIPCSLVDKQMQRIGRASKSQIGAPNQLIDKFNRLEEQYRDKINEMATMKNLTVSTVKTLPNIQKKKTKQIIIQPQINLTEKVKNLLNSIELHSENLDQELLSFRVHAQEIRLDKFDSRPHNKWMMKGQQNIRQKTYQVAIDCYKQSLIVHPDNFKAVFNVASLLQRQNCISQSKNWFLLASQFGEEKQKVTFGLAIVTFKKSQFKQSMRHIDGLIKDCGDNVPAIYYYVRALNAKKLGLTDNAKSDYRIIQPGVVPQNYNMLANLMFSLLFAKLRRMQVKFNCLTYMKFRTTIQYVLYENNKFLIDDKSTYQEQLDTMPKRLSVMNFFKRFPVTIIARVLQVCKYNRVAKGTILLIERENTGVLLTGAVALKNHQRNFQRPELIGLLSEGDIVNAGKLDNNISQRPNIWYVCQSQVEYLTMRQSDFNSFWKAQFTFEFDRKYAFLKNVKLLNGLSEVSLLRMCEMFELKEYPKNTILFNDCSYRSKQLTKTGKGFGLHAKGGDDWGAVKFRLSGELIAPKKSNNRLTQLFHKYSWKINTLKFKNLKYPGLYILLKGNIEIEDDCGFRTDNFIGQGDYFGQNLIFDSQGFQKFGRMVVRSETASLYFMSLKNLSRLLLYEKDSMKEATSQRKEIEALSFMHKRFHEVQKIKINAREEIKRLRQGV